MYKIILHYQSNKKGFYITEIEIAQNEVFSKFRREEMV